MAFVTPTKKNKIILCILNAFLSRPRLQTRTISGIYIRTGAFNIANAREACLLSKSKRHFTRVSRCSENHHQ